MPKILEGWKLNWLSILKDPLNAWLSDSDEVTATKKDKMIYKHKNINGTASSLQFSCSNESHFDII